MQGVLHPVDQRQLVGQVGDHGRDVRQAVEPGERGAALEVDQDEVEMLGGVGDRQPEHEGAQQLGLAGAGGADDQAVRAHAALCGLLEVQVDRLAVGVGPDRHPQLIPRRPGPPQRGHVQRGDCRRRAARSACCWPPACPRRGRPSGRPQRGEQAAQRLGFGVDSASGPPMSVSAVPSGGSRSSSPGVTRSPSVAGPGASPAGASAGDKIDDDHAIHSAGVGTGFRAAPSSSTTCSGSEPGAERAPPA